jgi:CheY-like chemotaxis protein
LNDLKQLLIVLAEDDAGHARLIEKNLRRGGISNEIRHLANGREAVDFLLGEGEHAARPAAGPLLLLLDLNLPELDGCQVLRRIKGDQRTRMIPVVMLTTTDNPEEITRCYQLGCNICVTKPVEHDDFGAAIRTLGMFLSIVQIPEWD